MNDPHFTGFDPPEPEDYDPPSEVDIPNIIDRSEALDALRKYYISTGRWQPDVPDSVVEAELEQMEQTLATISGQELEPLIKEGDIMNEAPAEAVEGQEVIPSGPAKPKGHERAGITKNKGKGEGKKRRKTAAASRRKNR